MIFIQLIEDITGLKQSYIFNFYLTFYRNWITRKWAGGLKQFILVTYGDKFSKFLFIF